VSFQVDLNALRILVKRFHMLILCFHLYDDGGVNRIIIPRGKK